MLHGLTCRFAAGKPPYSPQGAARPISGRLALSQSGVIFPLEQTADAKTSPPLRVICNLNYALHVTACRQAEA
jgi:hypothetical protein